MQCAFCGTENRSEYKFCGMCGVRLERRQADRRVQKSGVNMKCPSCGHMNEGGFKFCSMCGSRVERRMQERRGAANPEVRAGAVANAQLPTPEGVGHDKPVRAPSATAAADLPVPGARRGDPGIFRDESAGAAKAKGSQVSGTRASNLPTDDAQVIDPHVVDSRAAHSRDLDSHEVHSQSVHSQISGPSFLGLNSQPEGGGEYLLEDEPSRGGLRKLLLLVILAAIIGLVFVQWRSSIKANPKPAPAPSKAEPAASPSPQGENQAPAPASTDQPGKDASAPAKDVNVKDDSKSSTDKDKSSNKDDEPKPQADSAVTSVVPKANASPADTSAANDSKTATENDDSKPSAAAKAADDTRLPDHKPSAALLRAQQYLQGRGVPQNCEQGLLYLRAATEKNDPGAAIQMAALYSSGHCVKQDRVMAYRWFNSAHELEPANTWIQRNMDQLWAQMTSQERRLAGY